MPDDHRRGPRRRGSALDAAILGAAFDELVEVGYHGLTMDRVAVRAHASKASLYRRWPSRMELAVHAVFHALPDPDHPPDTGSLRGDLLALLRRSAQQLAGPTGQALRALLSDALRDPGRAAELRQFSAGTVEQGMHEIVGRAVRRGEIRRSAVTPRRLEAGQALLRQHFLFNGPAVPDSVIVDIVDDVVVPLLSQ
jgi:AcrR family transcriptional regulator